jgi:hypothetical protein
VDTANRAELQGVLEGVALSLSNREYGSIDEVAETLVPVQPPPTPE